MVLSAEFVKSLGNLHKIYKELKTSKKDFDKDQNNQMDHFMNLSSLGRD